MFEKLRSTIQVLLLAHANSAYKTGTLKGNQRVYENVMRTTGNKNLAKQAVRNAMRNPGANVARVGRNTGGSTGRG